MGHSMARLEPNGKGGWLLAGVVARICMGTPWLGWSPMAKVIDC